jgi:hypothetical protein
MWAHQQQLIDLAELHGHAAGFLPPGSGKTRVGLELINSKWKPPALVIAPVHCAHRWEEDSHKWAPNLKVLTLIKGSKAARVKKLQEGWDVVVINYESVWTLRKDLQLIPWSAVILDESYRIATPNARVTKTIDFYLGDVPHRLILTAWPAHKRLQGVFSQFRFVDRGEALGTTFSKFRYGYFTPDVRGFGWAPQEGAERRIAAKIAEKSVTLKEEDLKKDLGLPDIIEVTESCELSGPSKEAYESARTDWQVAGVDIDGAGVRALRMVQAASGVVMGEFVDNPKTKLLIEMLDEWDENERVVVWGYFRAEISGIAEAVKKTGRQVFIIMGGSDAASVLAAWKRVPGAVLVAQTDTGYGWEGVESRYCVFHGRPKSAATRHQCIRRIARHGQTRPVLVVDLVATGTLDEKYLQTLREERDYVDMIRDLVGMKERS